MPREIRDEEGTVWNCVQAYAGLNGDNEEKAEAASVEGAEDLVQVIATPSGGAQTIRLELKSDWEESLSDEEILDKIREKQ
jgi:hypothetical protein